MARKPVTRVEVYSVGGAVRDALLGRPVVDRDWVVTGATPEMLVASGYTPVGRDFPVFLHPETHEEYALARTERKHGQGYRGFEFFASPDVTVEQDLARRDLTINAMARAADGRLIDPYDGAGDLQRGVLRHVSPAFAEDPLRVLRVARFAARFGFSVAPGTQRLMRVIVASGELTTLAPERVWVELAKGLGEADPYRMLDVLQRCGALATLLPEVAARMATAPGRRVLRRSLAHAVEHAHPLDRRYALLPADLAALVAQRDAVAAALRAADALSTRLRVPVECRELAALAVRGVQPVFAANDLAPAAWLDLLGAADALRRPERLAALLDVCASVHAARTPAAPFVQSACVQEALAVVKVVDAGAVARAVAAAKDAGAAVNDGGGKRTRADAIAAAVRAARLAALRSWIGAQRRAPAGQMR
jgi:tRNA nucleotidyltransferase (CCA-adding enzyme)